MKTHKITAAQFENLVIQEARKLRAGGALQEGKARAAAREKRADFLAESVEMSRLSDSEYSSFDSVLAGCVWLAQKDTFRPASSDLLVGKIQESVIAELPGRLAEGVKRLEETGLDPEVKRVAVRYLKSLV